MIYSELIAWLLTGDISIQYQVYRDLLGTNRKDLQSRIQEEGWGLKFLEKRRKDGHWGEKFYQPKWTSTHYTLLDLKNLSISPQHEKIKESIDLILDTEKGPDGGVRPISQEKKCDVCLNGMFLNYACYFGAQEKKLHSVVNFILAEIMADGGFNCMSNRSGAVHSSLHSTLSVLEGINEYQKNGYTYRSMDLEHAKRSSIQFILEHQLFISDRTGKIIKKDFLRLSYPGRWRYDILKALDYFQESKTIWDERMSPAIDVLLKKRNKDGSWNLQAKHPGKFHFEMEKAGKPSRWNTLRALRVLKHYNIGGIKQNI